MSYVQGPLHGSFTYIHYAACGFIGLLGIMCVWIRLVSNDPHVFMGAPSRPPAVVQAVTVVDEPGDENRPK